MKASPRPAVRWLGREFYFAMGLVIVVVVIYGFSQTFERNLHHPPYPRPWILYAHAVVFPAWILLYVVQTALASSGQTRLHRFVGPFGLALGALLPIVAIATAIVMDRLHAAHHEQPDFFPAFFIVHVNDELAFIVLVGLAALMRARTPVHSRLMFCATCILTDAPFSRFPAFQTAPFALTLAVAYACSDALMFCGVLRDRMVDGRIHAVYRYAVPALVAGQAIAVWVFYTAPPWWLAVSHAIIGA